MNFAQVILQSKCHFSHNMSIDNLCQNHELVKIHVVRPQTRPDKSVPWQREENLKSSGASLSLIYANNLRIELM